jgi:peptidyl-prolyl cis-trans isomerase C
MTFMSLRRPLTGAFLAMALSASLTAHAAVIAKVDGIEITDEDIQIVLEDIGPSLPPQMQGPQRDGYILDYIIDMKLAAKKADQERLGVGPETVRRMAYYKDKVLMEALLGKIAKDGVNDAAMRKVYDEAKSGQKPEEEVSARHILVENENDAKAALKRVKGGEDFAKVADAVSKDPGSKGGDLGWFSKDRMVPEFADAAFKLKKGEISEPVKSQFGWHIIKLEDRRTKPFPSFEDVKDQLQQYVAQKAQTDAIMKLREGAKIERMTPAPAAPAVPAAPK